MAPNNISPLSDNRSKLLDGPAATGDSWKVASHGLIGTRELDPRLDAATLTSLGIRG
jgi:hypothetical protein